MMLNFVSRTTMRMLFGPRTALTSRPLRLAGPKSASHDDFDCFTSGAPVYQLLMFPPGRRHPDPSLALTPETLKTLAEETATIFRTRHAHLKLIPLMRLYHLELLGALVETRWSHAGPPHARFSAPVDADSRWVQLSAFLKTLPAQHHAVSYAEVAPLYDGVDALYREKLGNAAYQQLSAEANHLLPAYLMMQEFPSPQPQDPEKPLFAQMLAGMLKTHTVDSALLVKLYDTIGQRVDGDIIADRKSWYDFQLRLMLRSSASPTPSAKTLGPISSPP